MDCFTFRASRVSWAISGSSNASEAVLRSAMIFERIDSSNANPQITGNIITGNVQGWGIWVHDDSNAIIQYNDVWDNEYGTTGPDIPDQTGTNGNISVMPGFRDSDSNDFRLIHNSPCYNAGDPNFVSDANSSDFEGDFRIMGQRVDIGADEIRIAWNTTSGNDYQTIQQAVDDSNNGDVMTSKSKDAGHSQRNLRRR